MSKQSNRRKRAKQRGPLFTTPIQEKSADAGAVSQSDSPKQVKFLAAYATCGAIAKAAKAAGCCRTAHARWLKDDPGYPDRFALAQDTANDMLETEARRRAIDGLERMKFYKGQPIIDPRTIDPKTGEGKPYVEHEYSDRMLELLLKAHLPDKYTERKKVESVTTILDPAIQAAIFDTDNLGAEEVAEPPIAEEPPPE